VRRRGQVVAALVLVTGALATPPARGRTVAAPRDLPASGLGLELAFDPLLLLELSYAHRLNDVLGEHDLTIGGATAAPLYLLGGLDAWELTLGASLEVPLWRWLGVTVGLATSLATTENADGSLVAWGLELAVLPGLYGDQWFAALQVAWRPTLATHITHSQRTRDAFDDRYPDGTPTGARIAGPEDGWYGFPSHRWVVGLAGGVTFRRRVTLYGGGGVDATVSDQGLFLYPGAGLFPFYGQLGVVIHW